MRVVDTQTGGDADKCDGVGRTEAIADAIVGVKCCWDGSGKCAYEVLGGT